VYLFIKNAIFLVLLLLFAGSISLYAQNPSQLDVLTTEQGLLFRDVTSITQDGNGGMWFGTDLGLARYDGYHFKVYNNDKNNLFYIEDDLITNGMVTDDTGEYVWFMANEKLFKLEISTDNITAYQDIGGNALLLHKTADGSIWIMTDDYLKTNGGQKKLRLQKLVNGAFVEILSIPQYKYAYNRLISDMDGFIWWNTSLGTYKIDPNGDVLETFNFESYDWFGQQLSFTASFFDSCNNHYYFPQQERGIFKFDEATKTSKRIFDSQLQFYLAIEDHQKHIWFAGNTELYRMSPEGEFIDYTEQMRARLQFTKINDLFIDAHNLLWMATDNGLFKIRIGANLFTPLFASKKQGWGNTMRGIFQDAEGTIYAKCESENKLIYKKANGIIDTLQLKLDAQTLDEFKYTASFYVLDETKKNVFTLGTSLHKINLQNGAVKSYDQFIPYTTAKGQNPLIKLKDGRLLFGQRLSQLVLFDPVTEQSEPIFKDVKIENDLADFFYFKQSKNDNIIWIGTQSSGLLKINLNGSISKTYSLKTNPSISKNFVFVVEEDAVGGLWVGTYGGGLNYISSDGETVKKYTTAHGLPDNNVAGILTDKDENLWISTYNGLSFFPRDTEIFQNFYAEDGLSNNEFNYSSFFKDSNGVFYFGGMNGLNTFTSSAVSTKAPPPKMRFTSFSGYNSKTKSKNKIDFTTAHLTALEISAYDQYFQVDWTTPSYFQIQKNTYSTKLEGYEDRWFYQGNTASVRYNKLPAGTYVLKVQGSDSSGIKNPSILSIPITVRQFYYKKWWFIALVILLNIALVYALFKWRLKQLVALERLRTKISSDLHDDVGSLLSGLAMQTELMELNASEEDKSKLQKIAGISRNAISQMRDLVWSIDSRRTTSNDLIERMHELAEELLLPRDISFHIDSESIDQRNKKLAPQIKQNLFLIYKEAITNLLKHSDASHLQVTISNQAKECLFKIKDNGTTKETYTSTGLGLANMKLRAEAIGGTVSFETMNGFMIILRLPFQL
jgi:signal transduction histidine kinase/ligand-binding sensor domain-containing protein